MINFSKHNKILYFRSHYKEIYKLINLASSLILRFYDSTEGDSDEKDTH